ncbi:alpha/beta-hydrolase [Aspergillus sclerotioniger CBS 115572]|uniref:Alpha/beta-hydrolase n=1 Tax=Aspergillus sclerotioniger CBS 115572 TaxID=1450535 RepID=A0A317X4Q8_9EURO|nr:alpha/beta-hydrolase [Aspergillus sclerotioniger CBS 115572]PWY93604.1 alpha/beta-hydrolase [Aspergillus sclerotioniger CBS 115572]
MPSLRAILYTTFTLTTLPFRILGILVYYIPKVTRPHPAWTYRRAVGLKIFAIWWNYATAVEYRTPKTLTPGREGQRFVVIDPPSNRPALDRGILRSVPSIRPNPIGAVWYPALPSKPPNCVILHFHGGAYVLGGARRKQNGWGPRILSQHTNLPVLQPQYRLSVEENASFPAALQDGIAAYVYLLDTLGVTSENVILSGDSAGGNLVLAMLRYLTEEVDAGLPLPGAGLLWSPWLDLTDQAARKVDAHPCRRNDYLTGNLVAWGVRRFTPVGWERGHRFLSPLGREFQVKTPLFVQTGMAEVIHEDHVRFVEQMKGLGNEIEMCEVRDAPHDIFAAGVVLGFVNEAEEAIEQTRLFLKRVVGNI